jgi:UDP-N-acetylglucosamine:LPS N-acetylglucosamine transferase
MPVISKAEDRFWVTFDKEDANYILSGERVYHCYYPTNRNIKNLIRNTGLAIKVLREEKPDIIISSGAAIAFPFFLLGKIHGSKLIYVEVFDRVEQPTLTGRLVHNLADAFIVQWPELQQVYPDALYFGQIF